MVVEWIITLFTLGKIHCSQYDKPQANNVLACGWHLWENERKSSNHCTTKPLSVDIIFKLNSHVESILDPEDESKTQYYFFKVTKEKNETKLLPLNEQ